MGTPMKRLLILLLLLVNCAGAKDAPRAELVATPTPTPTVYAPTVFTQKDVDALPHGAKYWYQGHLLTKWGGTQVTPAPSTIWTKEESDAYFHPTKNTYLDPNNPANATVPNESTGTPGQPVMQAVFIAGLVQAMFIFGVRNKPEPQHREEQIKQINFDDMENTNRTLVVASSHETA